MSIRNYKSTSMYSLYTYGFIHSIWQATVLSIAVGFSQRNGNEYSGALAPFFYDELTRENAAKDNTN